MRPAVQLSAVHAVRGAAAAGGRQHAVAAPRRSRRNAAFRPLAATQRDSPEQVEEIDAERAANGNPLESVNPLVLGRRSRQFVDNVWRRVVNLGQVGRNDAYADLVEDLGLDGPDFVSPEASSTTVLVLGATGRVGRILVRKLLLRGYTVKALVRSPDSAESIPSTVQVITGDVGDYKKVREAMEGVDKVVVCMRARTSMASDVNNVEKMGMQNITKALLDILNSKKLKAPSTANGHGATASASEGGAAGASSSHDASNGNGNGDGSESKANILGRSKITVLRPGGKGALDEWSPDTNVSSTQRASAMDDIVKRLGIKALEAKILVTPEKALQFAGLVYLKGDAQVSGPLSSLPDGASLAGREGLVMKVRGDGKRYLCMLRTGGSGTSDPENWYVAGFVARRLLSSWAPVRLPFSSFRNVDPLGEPLDGAKVNRMGFKFESRGQPKRTDSSSVLEDDNNSYFLEVLFVKALPGGEQSDLIVVSCAGAGLSEEEVAVVVPAKRFGEAHLKNSGLGYTIVRPGTLFEEPGGAKALVFDQGGRINQGISCADVADVCLKSLHDSAARNKSFDVCYEYVPEVGSMYELVAHLPDKSNNFLTPALQMLEKNT